MKRIAVSTVLVIAMTAAFWVSRPLAGAATGPSSSDLLHAGASNADWVLPAHSYSGNRYIHSSQIDRDNVATLRKAWVYHYPDSSTVESAPIEWDGTIYVTSGNDGVYAIDARSGAERWRYAYPVKHAIAFWVNRGVALLEGKVYMGTLDGHLIALDARSGRLLWNVLGVHDPKNSFYAMAPVAYKNLLLIGASNGDWGGTGYITAFSAATGKRVWEWQTIARPGEPAHETWGRGDAWKTGGGSIWGGLAIDPATSTLYVDVGNPQPDFLGTVRPGKNLYTDSMVALDISGAKPRMRWYYQFTPHDMHDWDAAMPPVLFTGVVNGMRRALVAAGDKGGNFWVLDARDGKLLHRTAVTTQQGGSDAPSANGTVTCPATNGGVQYNGGSYLAETNAFYIPSIDQCATFRTGVVTNAADKDLDLGGPIPVVVGPSTGWMSAIDVDSGKFLWRLKRPLPEIGGSLSLGTGIVFTGHLDGEFEAYDARSGTVLWKYATGSTISAPPATYRLDGKRYVVVASGNPNANFAVPGLPATNAGSMVTAFSLP